MMLHACSFTLPSSFTLHSCHVQSLQSMLQHILTRSQAPLNPDLVMHVPDTDSESWDNVDVDMAD